jgi:hypothetical protein
MRNCAQRPNNSGGPMNRKYIGSKIIVGYLLLFEDAIPII